MHSLGMAIVSLFRSINKVFRSFPSRRDGSCLSFRIWLQNLACSSKLFMLEVALVKRTSQALR
jgi:hypothetical protein